MKKVILYIVAVLAICIVTICAKGMSQSQIKTEISDEEIILEEIKEKDVCVYVSESLNLIMMGGEFQNADIEARAELLVVVLDKFIEEGYVLKYEYNLEGEKPYIDVMCSNGYGPIIILKDIPPNIN